MHQVTAMASLLPLSPRGREQPRVLSIFSGGAISKAGGMDCGGRSGGFCILV